MSLETNGWSPSKRRPHVPPAAAQISTEEALAMLAHADSVSNLDKPPTPPITPDDALYMNGTMRFLPPHVANGYHYVADMSNYYKDKDIRTLDRFHPLKMTAASLLGKLRVHHLSSERDHLPTVDRTLSPPKKSYPPASFAPYAQQLSSVVLPLQSLVSSDVLKFCVLCFLWYASSAVTNNIGKQILNQFRFPVTLTFVQFGFVAVYCFVFGQLFGMTRIRRPTREIVESTLPLSVFQIVGHVFSSVAISRVPVSFVHTIKALSPLFTVLIYRFFFGVNYSSRVYTSLLPLTLGVMLACTFQFTNNVVGLLCALGSCVIFVTQNIFSKKLLFKESKGDRRTVKLDKTNLLFYSSAMAFALMAPLWFYTDCSVLLSDMPLSPPAHGAEPAAVLTIVFYFVLNGSSHFFQNIFAFNVLALTSPVTYSIASLVKRIFVIVASIIWFGQAVSGLQWVGIILTFGGLWMYQTTKRDIDRGENRLLEKEVGSILPVAVGGFNK